MNRYRFSKNPHGHFLDNKQLTGTTSVTGIINKELSYWASGMAVGTLGWKNPIRDDEGNYIRGKAALSERMSECLVVAGEMLTKLKLDYTIGQYFKLLNSAYKAHSQKKDARAAEGTDLHDSAEEWIKSEMSGQELMFHDPKLEPFIEWAKKNVKRFLFSEVCSYSESLWVGGKTDWGYEDMEGRKILSDLKSRKKEYFGDFVQLGGYGELIAQSGILDDDGNKLFEPMTFDAYAVFPLTERFTAPVVMTDTTRWREAFVHARGLYKVKEAWDDTHDEWKKKKAN